MGKYLIAYSLSGHNNDSYMLGEETTKAKTEEERQFYSWRFIKDGAQHPSTCKKCGRKIDPDFIDPDFFLRKKNMDISSTYDGYTIVSKKFKDFCERQSEVISGVEFIALPSQLDHYRLVIRNIIDVDKSRSIGIRFLYYCDLCHKYAGVFGTGKLRFKNIESPILKGMYRTDIDFAQAHEQHPVIIVGLELANKIKDAKLEGACLKKLEYS